MRGSGQGFSWAAYVRADDRPPQLIPSGVQVQAIGEEQRLVRQAAAVEHRIEDFDQADSAHVPGLRCDQGVRLPLRVEQLHAGRARLDGDVGDADTGQVAAQTPDEGAGRWRENHCEAEAGCGRCAGRCRRRKG